MVEARALRLPIEIEAQIIKDAIRCEAIIRNLSDEGILITVYRDTEIDLTEGAVFDLAFETSEAEIIKVHCTVMWSEQIDSNDSEYELGLKIVESTPQYEEFF
ncbi:MAG: PilZ domain-containing protein [Nitrospiraceae bacterium]|nr:MAG: PilZ domain-containing protein [Nitrospiraceae bacterium]